MPRIGYKQTDAHKRKVSISRKRKNKIEAVVEAPPALREYRCVNYETCLRKAALSNKNLDCTGCRNKQYPTPKHSDCFYEIVTQEAVACQTLLRAVFHPQAWRVEDRAKQKAMKKGLDYGQEEEPGARIRWWG
jgi:hypothetical protein